MGYVGYNVDIVLCIDTSVSMGSTIEELVKDKICALYPSLKSEMESCQKLLGILRVKVITFGDCGVDAAAIVESPFYELPAQEGELQEFVNGITVRGGNGPKNALEAIALALKSDWTTEKPKHRHIITVFTDNEALRLGERAGCSNYPAGMPKGLKELGAWWEKTDQSFNGTHDAMESRLIVFAPYAYPWTSGGFGLWNRVILRERRIDTIFEEIIAFLTASILKVSIE